MIWFDMSIVLTKVKLRRRRTVMSSLNEISRLLLDRYFKDDMNGFPPPRMVPSAVVQYILYSSNI